MEIKELRIGNLVYLKNNMPSYFMSISGFNNDIIYSNNPSLRTDRQITIEDIEPIPLTEEWLFKFGYKKFLDMFTIYDEFYLESIRAQYINKDGWHARIGNDMHTMCEIIYVHQLQNLYFALTGEELKIKE